MPRFKKYLSTFAPMKNNRHNMMFKVCRMMCAKLSLYEMATR